MLKIIGGSIIASVVVVMLSLAVADMNDNYGRTLSPEMNATFNNFTNSFNDVTNTVAQGRNETFDTQSSQDIESGINPVNALIGTKNMITNSYAVISDMIEITAQRIGIRHEWVTATLSILMIAMILILLAGILKIRLDTG